MEKYLNDAGVVYLIKKVQASIADGKVAFSTTVPSSTAIASTGTATTVARSDHSHAYIPLAGTSASTPITGNLVLSNNKHIKFLSSSGAETYAMWLGTANDLSLGYSSGVAKVNIYGGTGNLVNVQSNLWVNGDVSLANNVVLANTKGISIQNSSGNAIKVLSLNSSNNILVGVDEKHGTIVLYGGTTGKVYTKRSGNQYEVIDSGNYTSYAAKATHTHKTLTLQIEGTAKATYDASAAKTFNVTKSGLGIKYGTSLPTTGTEGDIFFLLQS